MPEKTSLTIIWTNDNLVTSENMVLKYAINSRYQDWWDEVTIVLWGATVSLASENTSIQEFIEEAQLAGVHVSACRTCAEQSGVVETLEGLEIEVINWGERLTRLLQADEKLITI